MKLYSILCFKNSQSINITDLDNEETNNQRNQRKRAYSRQFISILSGYILMIAAGGNNTWTSPALPHLTSENSEFPVTVIQGAWLVSIGIPFGLVGFILGPLIADYIGRKYTILIFGLTILSAMIFIQLANSYILLIMGRIILGVGSHGIYGILPFYIGEIASEDVRGRFLTFDIICLNTGAFLMNTAGAFLSYNQMNLVMILFPLLGVAIFPLTSETPYYLLMKGRDEEAIATKIKLSGEEKVENVMADIERMKTVIMEGQKSKKSSIRELFEEQGSRKAMIILALTITTVCLSGFLVIQAYGQEILGKSGSSLAPKYSTMIMTGIQIFAGLPSSQIIDRWGRRPSFLISGVLSAISLTIVGIFFFLKLSLEKDVSSVSWLPLVGLISFLFSVSIGLVSMPSVYKGELFSVKVKAVATMISSVITTIFLFLTKMLFPLINKWFGMYTSFWIFGASCLVGSLTVYCIAPETKDKNLEEVLLMLGGKKKHSKKKNDC